jgi:DNA-binding transcriptional MocR family regulator
MRTQWTGWIPQLPEHTSGPIYRAVVDVMAADIAAGRLPPGRQLPPHRVLAKALGVDLTTITRAYREAQRRGLVDATVGRGTFVKRREPLREEIPHGPAVDTGMILPPQPADAALGRRLSEGMAAVLARPDLPSLLAYRPSAGGEPDRAAGAAWLRPLLPEIVPERVLVCAGAQTALLALLTTFVRREETVLTEALAYPGFLALAAQLGIRLAGIAMDEEGLLPDALDEACEREPARALYTVPTIHNPTTATMSPSRREAIAEIVRRRGLLVFEDDAYGLLPSRPMPPLAALLPDSTFYVSSLSKCLTPGLRVAYLAAPGATETARLAAAMRATVVMAPPLTAALATRWIGDGTAQAVLGAIRRESGMRQQLAASILPADCLRAHPAGHHAWLTLPNGWSGTQFAEYARRAGLAVVPGEVFESVPGATPRQVRIALGTAESAASLEAALRLAADALGQVPAVLSTAG